MEVRTVGRVVWEVAPLNEDYWNEFPLVVVENVWLQGLAVTRSVSSTKLAPIVSVVLLPSGFHVLNPFSLIGLPVNHSYIKCEKT